MSTTPNSGGELSVGARLDRTLIFLRKKAGVVGVLVVVGFWILNHYSLVDVSPPEFLGTIVVVISWAILEMILDNRKSLDMMAVRIDRLTEEAAGQLYSLDSSQADFSLHLRQVRKNEQVEITHIGLSMTQAWDDFVRILTSYDDITKLTYRALILTSNSGKMKPLPKEVKDWCKQVPGSIDQMRRKLKASEEEIKKSNRQIRVEVKEYATVPHIHGFALKQPERISIGYYSMCRWKRRGEEFFYDWAEDRYRRVVGGPQTMELKDFHQIYEETFEKLWSDSKSYKIQFDSTQ